jgi:ABC-type uncharacterized transport system permease subunit
VHTGLLFGLTLAVAVWVLMRYTVLGFDIRALGANARAARFAGVPVTRTVVLVACCRARLPAWPARSRWPAAPAT